MLGNRVSLATWAFRVLGEWDQYTSEGQGGTLYSTVSTFLGLSGSSLSLLYYLSALICEMNDYSRKKKRSGDCLLSSNKRALLKMKKDTLELKVILLWRKHLSVGKPFLDCISPEPSLAPELVLSWARVYFIVFIFLFP